MLLPAPKAQNCPKGDGHVIHENRRNFLLASASALAGTQLEAQNSCKWRSRVSPAVMKAVTDDARGLAYQALSNKVTSKQLRRLGRSFEIFSNHMAEIGANADFESEIKKSGLLTTPGTYEQMQHVRKRVPIKLCNATFNQFYESYQDTWPRLKGMIDAGMPGCNAHVCDTLNRWADKIDAEAGISTDGNVGAFVRAWDVYAAVAITGLYTSVWGYMGWLRYAAFAGPIGAAAFVFTGLAFAIAGLFCID
jgi:hypothetical protein